MKCIGFSLRFALTLCMLAGVIASIAVLPLCGCPAAEPPSPEGVSTREARLLAARGIPLQKLNANVGQEVREVLENPSYFRRMPSQQIACDPQMFTFLVRRPEVMVNIWEVMGITKVTATRTSPTSFLANDGVGTNCKCDMIHSENGLHIYFGNGSYEGTMSPRKVTGRCVCLLRTEERATAVGEPNIVGTMDVFLKVDNFGADILTRSIGPFVGKTADYNFVETAKFISQISLVCRNNPSAAQALATQLNRLDDRTQREFAEIVTRIASNSADLEVADSLLARNEYRALMAEPQGPHPDRNPVAAPPPAIAPGTTSPTGPAESISSRLLVTRSSPLAEPHDGLQWSGGPQTVPAPQAINMQPSWNSTAETEAPLQDSRATPAVIAPRKANIFMRR